MIAWTCPNCKEVFSDETYTKLISGDSVFGPDVTLCPYCGVGTLAAFISRSIDERITTLTEEQVAAILAGDFSWQTAFLKKAVKKFANAEDRINLGLCEHLTVLSRRIDLIEDALK